MDHVHPFFVTDMARCFVVLWIPTVNHIPIPFDKPLHNGIRIGNISDNPNEKFLVKIETRGKDISISISSTENPEIFEHFLDLHYEDSSHNGMVKYSFDSKFLEDSEFGFDVENFPEVIYHMIKSFYHIHEFHEDESDSSLKPYLCMENIDIHKENNAALRHYLRNHEQAVLDLVKNAKNLLRSVLEMEKQNGESEEIKEYESFPSMYVMALGYDAYIHSLYDSIYNNECRIYNTDKNLRRRAFNIENSVRYFNVLYVFFNTKIRQANNLSILKRSEANLRNSEESLKQLEASLKATEQSLSVSQKSLDVSQETLEKANTNIEETRKSAKSSTRWAIGSIIIGFAVGVLSLVYSIVASNESSRQLEEVRTELLKTLKTLNDNSNIANKTDTIESESKSVIQSQPNDKTGSEENSIKNKRLK